MTGLREGESPSTLDDAKAIVEEEFLGVAGIHGVGKRSVRNSVRVYAEKSSEELESLLHQIERRCSPFGVEVTIEGKPVVSDFTEPGGEQNSSNTQDAK